MRRVSCREAERVINRRVPLAAGDSRESVVLGCAPSCQLQRAPLGKWLKFLTALFLDRSHNAGVEGSSPSLSTNSSACALPSPGPREGAALCAPMAPSEIV